MQRFRLVLRLALIGLEAAVLFSCGSLLAAAHPEPVELRTIKKFPKDQRDLFLHDSRSVVLDSDLETVRSGGFNVDPYLGYDRGFFAGIQKFPKSPGLPHEVAILLQSKVVIFLRHERVQTLPPARHGIVLDWPWII